MNGIGKLFPALFFAVNPTVKLPKTLGVPVITPEVALRVRPLGNAPVNEYVLGPLLAATENENGVPCVPLALELLVMTGKAAPATVMSSGFDAVALDKVPLSPDTLAVTLRVTFAVILDDALGVPLMTPSVESKDKPSGRVPFIE